MTPTDNLVDHPEAVTQQFEVDEATTSLAHHGSVVPHSEAVSKGADNRNGQCPKDTHKTLAVSVQDALPGHKSLVTHTETAGQSTDSLTRHSCTDTHCGYASEAEDGSAEAMTYGTPKERVQLADPFLSLAADIVEDLETVRIANENRLRQLTRTAVDSDGEERGFGLTDAHPDVRNLRQLVEAQKALEHQATLNLKRQLRKHPLSPWGKAQRGIGEKQLGRLLAVIGDPYWNNSTGSPSTVSQLWAYCGLHNVPSETGWVAARRKKGQRANWNTNAKVRAFLIAESMLKAGNREAYDRRKASTEGKLHDHPCVRCGPSGSPAEVGTPWSLSHRHADALRVLSKEMLKQLWREAKRLHDQA